LFLQHHASGAVLIGTAITAAPVINEAGDLSIVSEGDLIRWNPTEGGELRFFLRNFSYAEREENEMDPRKLKAGRGKIAALDLQRAAGLRGKDETRPMRHAS
jgi:hypothetical protein